MAKPASLSPFFLSLLIICCSGFLVGFSFRESFIPGGAMSFLKQSKWSLSQIGIIRRTLGDTTIITIPSTNPVSVSPTNPAAVPITVPSTNSPVPAIAYPPPSPSPIVPVINSQPPPSTPATAGQRWCVAKAGASQSAIQSALDYACGMGGADCSQIQQGGRCYNPNTLQNHASYAFNAYYQKNPIPTSCDFGGTATLVNTNPNIFSNRYGFLHLLIIIFVVVINSDAILLIPNTNNIHVSNTNSNANNNNAVIIRSRHFRLWQPTISVEFNFKQPCIRLYARFRAANPTCCKYHVMVSFSCSPTFCWLHTCADIIGHWKSRHAPLEY